MLTMFFPAISPVAFSIGSFAIYWYSLAYLAGIVFGYFIILATNKRFSLVPQKALDDLNFYVVTGIIIGGRLGYVIFYDLGRYLDDPIEILKLRNGGMSFHGGLIGVSAALYLLARKYQTRLFSWTDLIALVAPLGIFFGRIANFINGELYGRVTESSLGVIFRDQAVARHPSQLYEAALEGLLCFSILLIVALHQRKILITGYTTGLFLVIYALARMFCELFREPDQQVGFIFNYLTMGQVLCLPLLILGFYIIYNAAKPQVKI